MSGLDEARAIVRRSVLTDDFEYMTGERLSRDWADKIDEAALATVETMNIPYEITADWLLRCIAEQVREQR